MEMGKMEILTDGTIRTNAEFVLDNFGDGSRKNFADYVFNDLRANGVVIDCTLQSADRIIDHMNGYNNGHYSICSTKSASQ